MKIINVDNHNLPVYLNLCQAYEGEFSAITQKLPDENGRFALDTPIGRNILGYLLYENDAPIGLAAIKTQPDENKAEVCEFYIIPSCRKKALGKRFAIELFEKHPGTWEIKQITGAEYATEFWRKTLRDYTRNNYQEDVYHDEYWGRVVRQQFTAPPN